MTDRELIAAIAARLVSEARDGKLVAADLNTSIPNTCSCNRAC